MPDDHLSTLSSGLRCRCPRCGKGPLFSGFLKLAPACRVCGLDFGFADPADGPAFFVMSGVGLLVTGVWAWWAVAYDPSVALQIAVVFPALIVLCLATLRPVKAWLVAEQFVHKAEQGRFESVGKHGSGGFTHDRRAAAEAEKNESP